MSRAIVFSLFLAAGMAAQLDAQTCSADGAPQAFSKTMVYPRVATVLPVLNGDRGRDLRLEPLTAGGWITTGANGTLAVTTDQKAVRFTPATGQTQGQFQYAAREAGTDFVVSALVQLVPGETNGTPQTLIWTCDGPVCTFRLQLSQENGIRNVAWNFGHGAVLTPWRGVAAAKTYPEPCSGCNEPSYQVTATVDYYDGKRVEIGPATVKPTRNRLTLAWDFVAQSRNDSDYWRITYGARAQIRITSVSQTACPGEWVYWVDWGDGNRSELNESGHGCLATGAEAAHVYATDGSYTITVYYTEGSDSTGTRQRMSPSAKHFYARHLPPDPSILVSAGDTAKSRTFSPYRVWDEYAVGRAGGPLLFEWDFDDGTFAVAPLDSASRPLPVTHTFTAPGRRMVRLKVTDQSGAVGVAAQPVDDIPDTPPVPSFAFRCAGLACSFDAGGTYDDLGIRRYVWNFGGVTRESSEPSMQYTFPSAGAYAVTLDVDAYTLTGGVYQDAAAPARKLVQVSNAPAAAATRYFAVTPCRLFDSRDNNGAPLASGTARAVSVAGRCGVPANAANAAVALTVAVAGPTGAGHLQVLTTATSPPPVTTINFTPDRSPRAGNTIVPLASNGSVVLLPHVTAGAGGATTTHVVVDVVGYFSTDATAPANVKGPLAFDVLDQPCRVFDSGSLTVANPNTAYVKVRGATACGGRIPSTIAPDGGAAALNLIAVGATAPGHLLFFPSNAAWTSIERTSALNVLPNATIANGALLSLGNRSADDVGIFYASNPAGAQTRYVIDATGYFSGGGTLAYHPIRPCRAVDTRDASRGDARQRTLTDAWYQVRGNCGVPMEATAVAVTAAAVAPSAAGHLKLFAAGTPVPQATFLNIAAGEATIANTSIVRITPDAGYIYDLAARFELTGTATESSDLVIDILGYFAPRSAGAAATPAEEH